MADWPCASISRRVGLLLMLACALVVLSACSASAGAAPDGQAMPTLPATLPVSRAAEAPDTVAVRQPVEPAPTAATTAGSLPRPTAAPTPTVAPVPTATAEAAPTATPDVPPTLPAPSAPLSDWYRTQGAEDSGPCATANCGPAVVAMAIGYATGEQLAVGDIRTYLSGESCRGTDYTDAEWALDHYGIEYQAVEGMEALETAVNTRNHPVLVILYMDFISTGDDYLVPLSDPAKHYGRYHSYTDGHFVVVKGITDDGKWVIVNDPYVFDPKLGYYSNGVAKGNNRYYAYSEFEQAYRYFGYYGLEIVPD